MTALLFRSSIVALTAFPTALLAEPYFRGDGYAGLNVTPMDTVYVLDVREHWLEQSVFLQLDSSQGSPGKLKFDDIYAVYAGLEAYCSNRACSVVLLDKRSVAKKINVEKIDPDCHQILMDFRATQMSMRRALGTYRFYTDRVGGFVFPSIYSRVCNTQGQLILGYGKGESFVQYIEGSWK